MITNKISVAVKELTDNIVFDELWSNRLEKFILDYFQVTDRTFNDEHFESFPRHQMTPDNEMTYGFAIQTYKVVFIIDQNNTIYVDIVNSIKVKAIVTDDVIVRVREKISDLVANISREWLQEMQLFVNYTCGNLDIRSDDTVTFPKVHLRKNFDSELLSEAIEDIEDRLTNEIALYTTDFKKELAYEVELFEDTRGDTSNAERLWNKSRIFFKPTHPLMVEFKVFLDQIINELNRIEAAAIKKHNANHRGRGRSPFRSGSSRRDDYDSHD